MRDITLILKDFRETFRTMRKEEAQRQEIMESLEYRDLQATINECTGCQKILVDKVPDSREEHEMDKEELIKAMQEKGIKKCEEFKAKTRAIRRVNVHAVLTAMEGDIDNLMLVTSIKMKDLETFAKDNPEYKRDLRKCIIDEGFTISDIFLDEST